MGQQMSITVAAEAAINNFEKPKMPANHQNLKTSSTAEIPPGIIKLVK